MLEVTGKGFGNIAVHQLLQAIHIRRRFEDLNKIRKGIVDVLFFFINRKVKSCINGGITAEIVRQTHGTVTGDGTVEH